MTAGLAWIEAFPLVEADRAVAALMQAWREMAAVEKPKFNPRIHEPKLTRVVRSYVRQRVAPQLRLPGHWGTEGVENTVDFETGEIYEEGRTDITYLWNNETTKFVLVFEFKKLSAQADSRRAYLEDGMLKFVTGIYSDQEPLAAMVGILMSPRKQTVDALRRAIAQPPTAAALYACQDDDGRFVMPASLFPDHADFDTEHLRAAAKAPAHGTIRLAHLFVDFPWFAPPAVGRGKRKPLLEDA